MFIWNLVLDIFCCVIKHNLSNILLFLHTFGKPTRYMRLTDILYFQSKVSLLQLWTWRNYFWKNAVLIPTNSPEFKIASCNVKSLMEWFMLTLICDAAVWPCSLWRPEAFLCTSSLVYHSVHIKSFRARRKATTHFFVAAIQKSLLTFALNTFTGTFFGTTTLYKSLEHMHQWKNK